MFTLAAERGSIVTIGSNAKHESDCGEHRFGIAVTFASEAEPVRTCALPGARYALGPALPRRPVPLPLVEVVASWNSAGSGRSGCWRKVLEPAGFR